MVEKDKPAIEYQGQQQQKIDQAESGAINRVGEIPFPAKLFGP